MRTTGLAVFLLLLSSLAVSQTMGSDRSAVPPSVNTVPSTPQAQPTANSTPQPPNVDNYSVMLVGPGAGAGAFVLMHNRENVLELVEVKKTSEALSAGYVPVRAIEIGELIGSLKEEITRLTAENQHLQGEQAGQVSAPPPSAVPSQAELEARRRAQVDAENAARRQQLIQSWLMLRSMNPPPQPYQLPLPVNPNANRIHTNCTSQRIGDTTTTNCN